jgi:myo-inositol-1(or 4)-monophosphatase
VLVDALLVTGFPYTVREDRRRQVAVFAAFLEEAQAVRRLGSAALDLCYVAAGRFDGYWEEHVYPWDIAAGALIVEEAGGRVTGLAGQPFDPFRGDIVASNGALHAAMLTVIDAAVTARAGNGPSG